MHRTWAAHHSTVARQSDGLAVRQGDGRVAIAVKSDAAALTHLVWPNLHVAALALNLAVQAVLATKHAKALVILTATTELTALLTTELATKLATLARVDLAVREHTAVIVVAVLKRVPTNGERPHQSKTCDADVSGNQTGKGQTATFFATAAKLRHGNVTGDDTGYRTKTGNSGGK